ncbi:hypothetical protein OG2516_10856 [Oceanicola granulosus HTCC2516]|uniref:Uncharacterized protein n=1 Tax=Oceanicola granulosus (strain ATCC BAA-861 / DSM 15982 / KCTC 12143 / HTCC2516) TaxID=314256 RepID=Q2CK32_OCEGH|nr:hypothetical protein [Oceanicola granulosus]EAR52957.1 hypothetical protein OG2516_10856 [Oceanicola granulosus HTCC2516]
MRSLIAGGLAVCAATGAAADVDCHDPMQAERLDCLGFAELDIAPEAVVLGVFGAMAVMGATVGGADKAFSASAALAQSASGSRGGGGGSGGAGIGSGGAAVSTTD